jgi:hypothetical protein
MAALSVPFNFLLGIRIERLIVRIKAETATRSHRFLSIPGDLDETTHLARR